MGGGKRDIKTKKNKERDIQQEQKLRGRLNHSSPLHGSSLLISAPEMVIVLFCFVFPHLSFMSRVLHPFIITDMSMGQLL